MDDRAPSAAVFADLRVLDLSTRLSGAFCARLFADQLVAAGVTGDMPTAGDVLAVTR